MISQYFFFFFFFRALKRVFYFLFLKNMCYY